MTKLLKLIMDIAKGIASCKTPEVGYSRQQTKKKANIRAQHEIVNGRLKIFNVLNTHFRHMKPNSFEMQRKHQLCFYAIAAIMQLKFELEGTLGFEVGNPLINSCKMNF